MSNIRLVLTEDHIKLLKHIRWGIDSNHVIMSMDEINGKTPSLFGSNDVYETIDLILNGKPDDFNPLDVDYAKVYSPEQISYWDKLLSELPTAMDIILYDVKCDLGEYRSKWHIKNWRKVNKKQL